MTQPLEQLPSSIHQKPLGSVLGQCLLGSLLLLALMLYWIGLQHDYSRKVADLQRQTELRSAQLANTLAVQAQTLFASLDFVAQNLVAEYAQGNPEGFELAVRTATATYPTGSILQIAVANPQGEVVFSNLQSADATPASIADREHFLVHANSAESGLFISRPLMGRVSKLWTIQLSRPIRKNGKFAGVLVVSVAPSYLSSFFRQILDQPNDVITLLRTDGSYMAHSLSEESVLGKSVPKDRIFLTKPNSNSGFYDVVAPVDGIARQYAWHRVGSYPLILSIGFDKAAVWGPLREEIRNSEIRNTIGSVLLLMAAISIAWLSFQGRQAKAQAARSQELLSNLVTQVPGALFQLCVERDGSIALPYATPSLYALHQLPADAAPHDPNSILNAINPKDVQRIRAEFRKASLQPAAWQGVYQIGPAENPTHWMRYTVKPEASADGSVLLHGYVQDITQEQLMQQALRTSEQHLRLTMDAVNDGLWEWCLESNQVNWDTRCWEMLGYPERQGFISLETMLEWMHPSDRERFMSVLNAHLERNTQYHCEFRLRTLQGQWLWVEARGNVTDAVDGRPTRMLGTHTDISDRVAQAQLRRVLLDESAAAILLATPDRMIVQANRRAKNMFAEINEPLSGKSLSVLHANTESFEALAQCYEELRDTGYVRREWLFKLNDGRARWCDIHGTLLDPQDPQGQVIWTIIDIDDRYRAESDLRVAKQRLTAIIERFPGGVMVQEQLYGAIVAMNHELSEILGLHPSALFFPPELQARVQALLPSEMLLEPTFSAHETSSGSLRAEQTLQDGRTFEIHRIPLWDEGRSLGLFWLLRDITQTKQRESALEHLASTDVLTALPNRRAFMARLQQEFNAVRNGSAGSGVLIMLDIDFFKCVNDTWGHAIGDQVLKHLSALLGQSLRLRNGDMAGRLGGEEFVILLASTDLQGGVQLAERLRELIATSVAITDQGPINLTASLGVSVLDAQLSSIDQGLERADAALYHAKRHGRNQVRTWTPGMVITQSKAYLNSGR